MPDVRNKIMYFLGLELISIQKQSFYSFQLILNTPSTVTITYRGASCNIVDISYIILLFASLETIVSDDDSRSQETSSGINKDVLLHMKNGLKPVKPTTESKQSTPNRTGRSPANTPVPPFPAGGAIPKAAANITPVPPKLPARRDESPSVERPVVSVAPPALHQAASARATPGLFCFVVLNNLSTIDSCIDYQFLHQRLIYKSS